MKKIGMIVAMDIELNQYLEKIKTYEKLQVSSYDVYRAEVYGKQLYLVKSGVGEIAAAGATQYLITAFNVDLVINFGICGKINKDIKILDTLVVKSVVHYRFDLSSIDNVEPGVYMNNSPFMELDQNMLNMVKKIDSNIVPAICASGDIFLSKEEDINYLWEKYNADICEMEIAGIFITCNTNNVPCLSIKSVSDDGKPENFISNCLKAAKMHVELIDKIVKEF